MNRLLDIRKILINQSENDYKSFMDAFERGTIERE